MGEGEERQRQMYKVKTAKLPKLGDATLRLLRRVESEEPALYAIVVKAVEDRLAAARKNGYPIDSLDRIYTEQVEVSRLDLQRPDLNTDLELNRDEEYTWRDYGDNYT